MTNDASEPTPDAALVSCQTCDVAFLVHPGRPSCPVCGGPPGTILVELALAQPAGDDPTPEPAPASPTASADGGDPLTAAAAAAAEGAAADPSLVAPSLPGDAQETAPAVSDQSSFTAGRRPKSHRTAS